MIYLSTHVPLCQPIERPDLEQVVKVMVEQLLLGKVLPEDEAFRDLVDNLKKIFL